MNVSCPEGRLAASVIECEGLTLHDPNTEVGVVQLVEDLPSEADGDAAQLLPLGRLVQLGTILGSGCRYVMKLDVVCDVHQTRNSTECLLHECDVRHTNSRSVQNGQCSGLPSQGSRGQHPRLGRLVPHWVAHGGRISCVCMNAGYYLSGVYI